MTALPPPSPLAPPPPAPLPTAGAGVAARPRWWWAVTSLAAVAAGVVSFLVFRPAGEAPEIHTPDPAVQTVPEGAPPKGPPVLSPQDLLPPDPAVTAVPSG